MIVPPVALHKAVDEALARLGKNPPEALPSAVVAVFTCFDGRLNALLTALNEVISQALGVYPKVVRTAGGTKTFAVDNETRSVFFGDSWVALRIIRAVLLITHTNCTAYGHVEGGEQNKDLTLAAEFMASEWRERLGLDVPVLMIRLVIDERNLVIGYDFIRYGGGEVPASSRFMLRTPFPVSAELTHD